MDRLAHALNWAKLPETLERVEAYQREYKKQVSAKTSVRIRKRMLTDADFALGTRPRHFLSSWGVRQRGLRNRVNRDMEALVGCSWEEFREHLSSQFRGGMTWENHGEWHLDHVVPLCRFHLVKELLCAFHYTNIRPIWSDEHRRKSRWERKR
jgi:hypothetical protein